MFEPQTSSTSPYPPSMLLQLRLPLSLPQTMLDPHTMFEPQVALSCAEPQTMLEPQTMFDPHTLLDPHTMMDRHTMLEPQTKLSPHEQVATVGVVSGGRRRAVLSGWMVWAGLTHRLGVRECGFDPVLT